jgi:hypothetical protein
MCMADGDDFWDLWKQDTRTARKEHTCGECGRTIMPGEPYEVAGGLWDGDSWQTHKTCGQCVWARLWLLHECSGWLFGKVREDLEEHWYDSGALFAETKGADFMRDLGVRIVGMKRQWRYRDGTWIVPPDLKAVAA